MIQSEDAIGMAVYNYFNQRLLLDQDSHAEELIGAILTYFRSLCQSLSHATGTMKSIQEPGIVMVIRFIERSIGSTYPLKIDQRKTDLLKRFNRDGQE